MNLKFLIRTLSWSCLLSFCVRDLQKLGRNGALLSHSYDIYKALNINRVESIMENVSFCILLNDVF